ncbi:MAG: protein translocase subunit [Trizodia sp. TS-e1964]|nr:MAG: protein translocase subunit [Trizodia sp. TS-e1964]
MEASSPKDEIIHQIKAETALTNAKQLIGKIHSNCFQKCIDKPGPALSASDQACFTQCMEKYILVWNTVSRQVSARVSAEAARLNAAGGLA